MTKTAKNTSKRQGDAFFEASFRSKPLIFLSNDPELNPRIKKDPQKDKPRDTISTHNIKFVGSKNAKIHCYVKLNIERDFEVIGDLHFDGKSLGKPFQRSSKTYIRVWIVRRDVTVFREPKRSVYKHTQLPDHRKTTLLKGLCAAASRKNLMSNTPPAI